MRSWTMLARFHGLKTFRFGCVLTDRSAAVEEARTKLKAAFAEHCPLEPEILAVEPGAFFFVADSDP